MMHRQPALSRRALAAADTWVRIPMAHGVDSPNVGAAAAVAFYAVAAGRPKSPGGGPEHPAGRPEGRESQTGG
jgi:tRNA C32,U32 (ribose-2'-O)-methylase TrmJ